MKRVAAEIAHKEPRIDVLINNAGAMFASRRLTEDGLEYTMLIGMLDNRFTNILPAANANQAFPIAILPIP